MNHLQQLKTMPRMLYVIPLAFVAGNTLSWLYRYLRKVWCINRIPGRFMLPFIGTLSEYTSDGSYDGTIKLSKEFCSDLVYRVWYFTRPIVVLHKVESAGLLLGGSKNLSRSLDYSTFTDFLGPKSLILSDGEIWYPLRKLVTPSFHFDLLKEYLGVMNQKGDGLLKRLESLAKLHQKADLKIMLSQTAFAIIYETSIGQPIDLDNRETQEFFGAVNKLLLMVEEKALNPLYSSDFIFRHSKFGKQFYGYLKELKDYSKKVVLDKEADFTGSFSKHMSFLDTLLNARLDNPEKFTIDFIRDEVNGIMIAGDTTSMMVTMACYLAARHPEIQAKLQEEVDRLYGSSNFDLNASHLGELKYLECVLKESMRLYPPGPAIGRKLDEDLVVGKYTIPKGTDVVVPIYAIHHNEEYYPNPEDVIPERFTTDASENRNPYAYLPFSAGKRNCIGQRFAMIEAKLLFAKLIRNFEFECSAKENELDPFGFLALQTKKQLMFGLKKRFE